jgi:methyltransferase (TIGR00027 family)
MSRRVESKTSRTAQMTCLSRACSALEINPYYQSHDHVAPLLLPGGLKPLLHIALVRRLFARLIAPKGIYEYVIARTKYIDEVFKRALAQKFDQVLILGAGFDTRAIRFQETMGGARVFELDIHPTQQAKIGQYKKRGVAVPANLTFIAIDFDQESISQKLKEAGFNRVGRSLFILEGLLMYLQPDSVEATFQTIRDFAGKGSLVVFDYVHASVLRKEGDRYGEKGIVRMVSGGASEQWHFGIEEAELGQFLAQYNMRPIDHQDAEGLERLYFSGPDGKLMARINGTHCLVIAEKE